METVRLFIYPTYIAINSDHKGNLTDAPGQIRDVLDLLREIIYIPRFRRYQVKTRYYLYDTDNLQMRVPRYMLLYVEDCLKSQGISFEHIHEDAVKSIPINLTINKDWTDRPEQITTIAHLSNIDLPMRASDLQTGKGKAQPLNSLIRIPNGWKRMGDIQIDDIVISADGTETKVTGIYPQGKLIVYRVTFGDGRYVDCSGDHLWEVFYVNTTIKRRWRIVNTLEMLRLISMPNPRVYVKLITPENYSDTELPIHPYTLGVYLGDGCSRGTTPHISTPDQFIVDKLTELLPSSLQLNKVNNIQNERCETYTIRQNKEISTNNRNDFIQSLKDLNLYSKYSYEKFIPVQYLEGSKEQRLNILRGLLDTDGYVEKTGTMSYCTTSFQLAKDVQYLIRSLGGIASISTKQSYFTVNGGERKEGRLAYVVNIRHTKPSEFFTLPKKVERLNDDNQYSTNLKLRVVSVEKLNYSTEMQCISVDHPSRLYVTDDFVVTHNSYCAIRAITELKTPTLLICGGLVEQWVKEFETKTDIDMSDVYVIKGAGSLIKLFNSDKKPTIFIASIDTLRAYVTSKELPYSEMLSYPEFLEKYNIGIKIVDEFHLNFGTIVNIDLFSNVANNLYLSATPKRSSGTEKEVFKRIFPIEIIDGGGRYDRYVNISLYRYNLEYPKETMFNTQHGYSHSKYESYIINTGKVRQRFIDTVLFPLINSHYINKKTEGQKLLIFCRTVAFCELIRDYLINKYTDFDIRTYTQTDSECNLDEADIIVSTPQSCGTGKDISNLRTVLQTCSIGSEPLVEQILGRLRKLPNGDTPEFVDIMNAKLGRHWAHYRSRAKIYKERAFRYNEFNLC